jgi:hypothetical protein
MNRSSGPNCPPPQPGRCLGSCHQSACVDPRDTDNLRAELEAPAQNDCDACGDLVERVRFTMAEYVPLLAACVVVAS